MDEAEAASVREAANEAVIWLLENDSTKQFRAACIVQRIYQYRLQIWPPGWPKDWPPVTWKRRSAAVALTSPARRRNGGPETWPLPPEVRRELTRQDTLRTDAIVRFINLQMARTGLVMDNALTPAPETWPLRAKVHREIMRQQDTLHTDAIVRFVSLQMARMNLLVGDGILPAKAARDVCDRWKGSSRFAQFLAREYRRNKLVS